MKKLITFYFSYFTGKCHFEEDGTQHHLILQPISRYFKMIANTKHISSWKSKGLSNESIKPPITSDNNLISLTDYLGDKIRLKLGGSCLKQPIVTYSHRNTLNICIVYKLGASSSFNGDPTLKNSLFGVVRLTKNAKFDKYQCLGSGLEFDRKSSFSFPGGGFGQNVIIFGADMSSSVHADNKKRIF